MHHMSRLFVYNHTHKSNHHFFAYSLYFYDVDQIHPVMNVMMLQSSLDQQ